MHKIESDEEVIEVISLTDEVTLSGQPIFKNKIIGKRTRNDKQYCEKVDPLDLHSTEEIRKYIRAVEKFLNKKESLRSVSESQNRILKYIFFFGLGATIMFTTYSLFVEKINF